MAATYCTFRLGGLLFGVDVHHVQEILRKQSVTIVPCAPDSVAGLMNVRGEIVTVVDGRRRFGLPQVTDDDAANLVDDGAHVILRCGGEWVSLVVDAEGDVVEVSPDRYEDLPDTVPDPMRSLLTGSYKMDDALLLIVDADSVAPVTTA